MTYSDPLELLSGDADPGLVELPPKIFTKFISCVYYGQIVREIYCNVFFDID